MRRSKKVFLYAGAIAAGAIAILILVPTFVSETNGQSPDVAIAPVQAETMTVAQAEPIRVAQAEEPAPAAAAPSPTFAGGATSIQESYADWQVSCGISAGNKVCSMIQQQTSRETRQRVLAIELRRTSAGMEGALILPFGILLDDGATLGVDAGAAGPSQRFRTCLPAGCVVPLTFDSEFVAALARGGQLNVTATAETGDEINFAVSLRGFSAASTRIAELIS